MDRHRRSRETLFDAGQPVTVAIQKKRTLKTPATVVRQTTRFTLNGRALENVVAGKFGSEHRFTVVALRTVRTGNGWRARRPVKRACVVVATVRFGDTAQRGAGVYF